MKCGYCTKEIGGMTPDKKRWHNKGLCQKGQPQSARLFETLEEVIQWGVQRGILTPRDEVPEKRHKKGGRG